MNKNDKTVRKAWAVVAVLIIVSMMAMTALVGY